MNKKLIIPTSLFIVVLIFSFFALSQEKHKTQARADKPTDQVGRQTSQILLFYGDGCPHCALVEEYINQNGVEVKVSFAKKEVYSNKQNADELAAKAKICGMPTDSIGVPFLWDGSRCLVGDQDIIEFFKARINQN